MASNVERGADAEDAAGSVLDRVLPGSDRGGRATWAAAVAFYGGGDTVTTFAGLAGEGTREAGPVASALTAEWGIAGLVALKLLLFVAFYVCWLRLRPPRRATVPAALAVCGLAVTAWNLLMLA